MKRLLCIVGSMNAGGAETFLMKIYRCLDKTKYQMDFAVAVEEKGFYDDEILRLGGKIHHIVPKSHGVVKNFNSIVDIVKNGNYDYVLRTSQHSLSALELFAAKIGGAKKRIFRSSNSNTGSLSSAENLLHKLCMFMPKCFATTRIAPSSEAAKFMYGNKCITKGTAHILHNAVDISVYRYDDDARKRIRQDLGLEDHIVIGHVGRFAHQKNHKFLLEAFKEIYEKNHTALLLLVGKGELEEDIKSYAMALGIYDHIIFTGVRSDIPHLLSAMDVFVMPSFYEGMPNTVIEAQATGLPCIISDTVTKEANITGLVEYLPLNNPNRWAERALNAIRPERTDTKNSFIANKYDIESVADEFVKLVFGDMEK